MTTFHFNAFKKVKAQMSIQDLGRDMPNPPNHDAAVKLVGEQGGTYSEALQRTDMQEKLKQYENLQGQGWFHPDIVNELRSKLATTVEALEKLKKRVLTNEQMAIVQAALAKLKEQP